MTKRILLAGVLGGLGLFVWGGLSHTVLGLGDAGVQSMPQQEPVVQAMKTAMPQSGMYVFPQGDKPGTLRADQVGGSWGILIYHPTGATANVGPQLARECILNIVLATLAAFLLSRASLDRYISRVGFVAVAGLITALMTNVEFWNWYGFPTKYTVSNVIDNGIGFLIVGLIAAAFVKPMEARAISMPKAA
jgi:hypothetical protein